MVSLCAEFMREGILARLAIALDSKTSLIIYGEMQMNRLTPAHLLGNPWMNPFANQSVFQRSI
ncbi:MAG: hypothetical protein B0A82_22905 [Alkalinema sp. CACIAM 70d]|nr:MAG: hypothetical protein B0A82_22905 [Alkalinema sp. CACIAM 70d]